MTTRNLKTLLATALLATAGLAAANDSYPQKTIRFIVPNEAGGTTDVLIRALVPSLTKSLGQPLIVENRAGGSATIGSAFVARAAPDGYTLLVGSSATSSNNFVMKNSPFKAQDLEAVARIAVTPYFLIASSNVKANTLPELVQWGKSHPGQMTYASSGSGTSPHLSGARFGAATGIDLLHVPFKGTAPALNDLIAGRVDIMFVGLPSAIAHINSGRLKALGVAADRRLDALSSVPTVRDAIGRDFEANSWFGVLAPRNTPEPIKTRIAEALRTAVNQAEVRTSFAQLGATPLAETPAEAQKFFVEDLSFWKQVTSQFKGQLD